jgi:hypothetical protein
MRSKLFSLTVAVVVIFSECYSYHHLPFRQMRNSKVFAEYDHNNDVKTVDILSLETIRSTLVRQGIYINSCVH